MIEWLLTPIDASRAHELNMVLMWHARLMMLAWGLLIPIGVIVCRFFKIPPKQNWPKTLDNRMWWHCHLTMQISSAVLSFISLAIVLQYSLYTSYTHIHQPIGWAMIILLTCQVLAGIFRGSKGGPTARAKDGSLRGDHYDMTTHRVVFEYFHKTVGYTLVYLSIAAILSGMWYLNAPHWMWLIYGLWWVILIWTYITLQKKGRAKDTYQAIWGPDPSLPGNQRKPIGFGITQVQNESRDS